MSSTVIEPSSPVTALRGVGDAKAKALGGLGIRTVGDLASFFPRAYQNRGAVTTVAEAARICRETGDAPPCSFILTVGTQPTAKTVRRGMSIMKFRAFDETGVCELTFFNQSFYKDLFSRGAVFRFWGRPVYEYGALRLSSPAFEACVPEHPLAPIIPVYPLTKGVNQKMLSQLVREALKYVLPKTEEYLSRGVLEENSLCTLSYAYRNIHFPESLEALESARRRFAFDRIFCVSAALAARRETPSLSAPPMTDTDYSPLLEKLPFTLTGAQARAAAEICRDMAGTRQMCRILCGDVGSGKTAVAAISAYVAVKNGYQCALMVPTEILAKQHYGELQPLFEALGYKCVLLTGSMSAAEKKRLRAAVAGDTDTPDFIIGTHALISDSVSFRRLGLIITDEQHRFGVNQRAILKEKSSHAHTLVMSATPIPRTLSLVFYGDLSMSVLDELPPGRKKTGTFTVDESYRRRLLGFIAKQAAEGHQTYIVCPAIEENESSRQGDDPDSMYNISFMQEEKSEPPLKAAVAYAAELKEELPGLRIGFVHGKMKPAERDAVMAEFCAGELDVLVSTTVIEVGVNVPSATLMVVENAERFGLSQLHQLRGRVGRGNAKSYCILVSDTKNETSRRRLEIMCATSDGYKIAEEDLKLRGPGDFFAENGIIRQHGAASDPILHGMRDSGLYERAILAAKKALEADPELSKPENRKLKEITAALLKGAENTIS